MSYVFVFGLIVMFLEIIWGGCTRILVPGLTVVFLDLGRMNEENSAITDSVQNVDALYQINKGLAKDLQEEKKSIGEVYLGLAPFLKLYAFYCENHDAALEVVAKLKKKKKEFATFDEVCRA